MPAVLTLDKEDIIKSVEKHKGKISLVARELNCLTGTLYTYAKRYKSVQKAIDSSRAHWDCDLLDRSETKLYLAVENGKSWAIKFVLETKGRTRGYATKQKFELQTDKVPVQIKVNVDNAKK